MTRRSLAALASFAVALLATPVAIVSQTDEVAAIRDLFTRYKSALLGGDGATAAGLVDAETFAYFEEIKQLTLEGGEEAVRARPFVDRLLIVTMRHQLSAAELAGMDLEGLLRHAIDAGWIGKQSIAQLGIGAITVDGDRASAVAVTPGAIAPTTPAGEGAPPADELLYRFVRENGEWRFGFRSLVESINQVIAQLTAQMGTDQDALIFVLVEQLSGRKVLPEVWSSVPGAPPPGASAAGADPAPDPAPAPQ